MNDVWVEPLDQAVARIAATMDEASFAPYAQVFVRQGDLRALLDDNARLRAALAGLLDEAEDVFVCMADATDIDRHNFPPPFIRARLALNTDRTGE